LRLLQTPVRHVLEVFTPTDSHHSWIDLDAKRLEPWFQLSKEGGEYSESSLLLQYPFDFLPFVPIAAFRRK
jgi:hypothetical protein